MLKHVLEQAGSAWQKNAGGWQKKIPTAIMNDTGKLRPELKSIGNVQN